MAEYVLCKQPQILLDQILHCVHQDIIVLIQMYYNLFHAKLPLIQSMKELIMKLGIVLQELQILNLYDLCVIFMLTLY